MAAKEPRLLTWGSPLVGLAGTVAGMLIAFARIGTAPQWETVLVAVAFSIVVVVALCQILCQLPESSLIVIGPAVLKRQRARVMDPRAVRCRARHTIVIGALTLELAVPVNPRAFA